jgi:hypothetical protein
MTARTCLFALALLAPALAAQPAFVVPKSWERVADAPGGATSLSARGPYTCWLDRKIIPGTEHHRARSYVYSIYRHKAGGKPEKLGGRKGTHGEEALLGPRGEVATGTFGHAHTLHLPGQAPVALPRDADYHALRFTPDGLLCLAYRYARKNKNVGHYEARVVLFPIAGGKAQVDRPRVVRPWFATDYNEISGNFLHGDVFLSGDYLVRTGTRIIDAKGRGRPTITVWDAKNGRTAWEVDGRPAAVDGRYVYSLERKELVRRQLAGKGEAEQLPLPEWAAVIDFQPPKLFALVTRDKRWVASLLDLNTGDRAEYALEGPTGRHVASNGKPGRLSRPFYVYPDPDAASTVPPFPVAGDVATGELRAARGNVIYRVPVARRVQAEERPRWAAVP